MVQEINQTNFQETINANDIVLVDFYAEWCGPCKALHPTLEDVSNDFEGKAVVTKINIDKNPQLSEAFQVRSVPSLFYFKKGKLMGKQHGAQPKANLTEILNTLIQN